MTTYRNALEKILKEKGYEVTVVDGNNDQAKQNEQINTFITQGVDALIINPVMTSAADTIIATVKDRNIPPSSSTASPPATRWPLMTSWSTSAATPPSPALSRAN